MSQEDDNVSILRGAYAAWLFENGKVVEFMEHFDTHTAIMAGQD